MIWVGIAFLAVGLSFDFHNVVYVCLNRVGTKYISRIHVIPVPFYLIGTFCVWNEGLEQSWVGPFCILLVFHLLVSWIKLPKFGRFD